MAAAITAKIDSTPLAISIPLLWPLAALSPREPAVIIYKKSRPKPYTVCLKTVVGRKMEKKER